uniref:Uncharacterized protein n=1 Tax=Physcomitrium patens TaxID=3218 RepID=A0A7I3ZJK7_PHYPA
MVKAIGEVENLVDYLPIQGGVRLLFMHFGRQLASFVHRSRCGFRVLHPELMEHFFDEGCLIHQDILASWEEFHLEIGVE